jgi:NAD-reducing hydrogenase large subunit
LAGAKATDMLVGVDKIPVTAEKMRRLMHYGQVYQSHALHFFHLASPDLLFGFDAPVEKRNVIGVIEAYPEVAKKAVLMRKFGQEVIKATGGKKVHPTGAIPGGINKNLTIEERDALKKDADTMVEWAIEAVELCKKLTKENLEFRLNFGSFESNHVSIVRDDGCMDLYDGTLRAIDADGNKIFDKVQPAEYADYIGEEVRPWTYMKFPHIRSLGKEKGWYRVGPLSRVNCCDFIDTELAEKARQEFMALGNGKPVHASMAYHWARCIEILHSAEKIRELLDDPDLQGTELVAEGKKREKGYAWIEAPRGTLFHHYEIDTETDQITLANLIVSTTSNNEPMNRTVQVIADQHLKGKGESEITEGLLNHIEVGIRAYDPCLSCATHALGKMRLHVELVDAAGTLIDEKFRG